MKNFLQRLQELSSAEDFLQFFSVPFDPQVLNVSRLHILQRFFQYLRQENMPAQSDEVLLFTTYRRLLTQAYTDFVHSTPAREKVFKVFQDINGTQHVPLERLRAALPLRAAS